jgi:hypothetical protein
MKINLLKYVLAAITTILTLGCDSPNLPNRIEYKHNALINLTVNESNQEFYIYNTFDYSDRNSEGKYIELRDLFVNNASISINTNDFSFNNFVIKEAPIKFNYYSKGFYYTNDQELLLLPNKKYFLEIVIDNEIIYGTTTTPGDFDILEPKDNSIIKETSINGDFIVKWSQSKSAFGYICKIFQEGELIFPDSSYYSYSKDYTKYSKDTLFVLQKLKPGTTEINIFAFDENYYNHTFGENLSVGVDGAYGYFGSSVKKGVSVYVE